MNNYIENKTALITGATSGIGKQVAKTLAKMNTNLILVGRDVTKLENLKNEIIKNSSVKADVFQLDVRYKDKVKTQMATILEKHTVDILINNAGLALGLDKVDEGDIEQWEDMIDTNVKGLLYMSRAVIPQMRALDTAHVINIGSVAGKISYPNGNVYCATKAAVHSLGESMNIDLYGTNVKVTTVAPGAVETNFASTRFSGDEKKSQAVYEGYTPLSAQDIADTILNVLNTPKHVNIQYLDIMPTAQRNPYTLFKTQ